MAARQSLREASRRDVPNHAYPIRNKLKECTMMKNYMTTKTFARGTKPKGDLARKAANPYLEEKAVMLIYGRPALHESWHKLKLTSRQLTP
jgi:hypothetical protein